MKTFLKAATTFILGFILLLIVPFFVSAQASSTGEATQQTFLAQLQSLQQELVALDATISSMIASLGGTSGPSIPGDAVSSQTSSSSLSVILPPNLSGMPSSLSSEDVSTQLLQAVMPSVSSSAPYQAAAQISVPAASAGISAKASSQKNIIVNQFDPSCISGLFAEGAQCGGLYYCGVGTNATYWSSTACANGQ